jgi:molybdenum cofactor guanylyltransferase
VAVGVPNFSLISRSMSLTAPFLNERLVDFLIYRLGDAEVVVPFWRDRLQPLHAVCRKSVLARLQRQLDAGNLRPTSLSEQVTTRIIDEAEICAIDPDELSFVNLNSPQEYQSALQRWRRF